MATHRGKPGHRLSSYALCRPLYMLYNQLGAGVKLLERSWRTNRVVPFAVPFVAGEVYSGEMGVRDSCRRSRYSLVGRSRNSPSGSGCWFS